MLPTLKPTDMVISVSPERVEPSVGRIVVFQADFAGQHIPPHVHRIVGRQANGTWQTKGDHSSTPDPWNVQPHQVQGVVIAWIPMRLVRSPLLLGGLVFLVAVV